MMTTPTSPHVDISHSPSPHGAGNRLARMLWGVVYVLLFRISPRPFQRWRVMLLRLFGARVSFRARVHPRARIWAPWNLEMEEYATLGDHVDCYCVDTIRIGAHTVVSQYCYLCGATHDFEKSKRPLIARPITLEGGVWLAADVFVGPGVTIGEGTVVGARSSVFEDLPPWKICHGTPAKPVRDRVITSDEPSPPDPTNRLHP